MEAAAGLRLVWLSGDVMETQRPDMLDANPRTRTDQLVRDLSEAVLRGDYIPGEKLDEHSLAERYGVSRTPVREALRQLATTGLVEMRPRRGAVVAILTPERLGELFGAMAELEATCARLSAIGMTPVERRRLEERRESMAPFVDANDTDGFATANLAFHTEIYAGAHNGPLAEMAGGLRQRLLPYRRAQFLTPGRLPRSHAEHGAVVEAILAADAAAAHAAMLRHVSLVEDSFEQLASRPPKTAAR